MLMMSERVMSSRLDRKPPSRAGMTFTLFVILPTEDVCSLRNLGSGVTIRDVRQRLELTAGIPAQIYRLTCPDGQYLHEEYQLLLDQNVWDGYILRVQLFESWAELYHAIMRGSVDQVYHNGAVHLGDNTAITVEEEVKIRNTVQKRGNVALFLASYYGLDKMCQMLLSVGVDVNEKTPFDRRPLHAATCRDNDRVMDILLQHGATVEARDTNGDSPLDIAKKFFSKNCVRKLRVMQLNLTPTNGHTNVPSATLNQFRKLKVSFSPPPSQQSNRPPTVARSRLTKRQTMETVNVQSRLTENGSAHSSSHEHFIWDTDDINRRVTSAARFRQATPTGSRQLSGAHRSSSSLSRNGTGSEKQTVHFDDPRSQITSRDQNIREKSRDEPQKLYPSILKTRNRNGLLSANSNHLSANREETESQSPHRESDRPLSHQGSVKSVSSAPGTIVDTSGVSNSDARSVESAPARQEETTSDADQPRVDHVRTASSGSSKRPKTRMLVSRQKKTESWRTMKRRIKLAADQRRIENGNTHKRGETFDEWLNRKRKEEKRDGRETDSDDSTYDNDNHGSRNTHAFEEWLKNQRERRPEGVAVADLHKRKTRPLKGLISTGTDPVHGLFQDPKTNISAYREWRERHANCEDNEKPQIEFELEKKKVEAKRQSLLSMAVSYDEWMEHTEERKDLMKQILHANMKELNRIEEETLKKRAPGQISFKQWRDQIEKQEAKQKKLIQRLRAEEQENERRDTVRSSACVSHDVWRKRKEEESKKKILQEKLKKPEEKKVRDNATAFETWVRQKHEGDVSQLQQHIQKERDLIKILRQRRMATVTSC